MIPWKRFDITKCEYHFQLIVKKGGEVEYSTFPEEDWMVALDCFSLEMGNPRVTEAQLLLHRTGSPKPGDHIPVEEYTL